MAENVVHGAAVRYGARDYAGTVRFVAENEHLLDDDTRVPALMQAFYAARDGGMQREARELAVRIAAEDPNVPTIQPFLS
jgi:hypothetical protein